MRKTRASAALDVIKEFELANIPQTHSELVAYLDPERLDDTARAAEAELLRAGEAENTLRSYRAALRYWAAWFRMRYGRNLFMPVPVAAVVQFILDHALREGPDGTLVSELPKRIETALVTGGFKATEGAPAFGTLKHRVSVMSKAHKLLGESNPCSTESVRELLARTRRSYATRDPESIGSKKPALTIDPLEAMLSTCDDSMIGLRDRALLLFAFSSGGRRRSEVPVATVENTRKVGEAYVFSLYKSKTNQAGEDKGDREKPVTGSAARALERWMMEARITSGPIFRRILRGGNVTDKAITPETVRNIVIERAKLAGMEGEGFSAHSLRSGFVTVVGNSSATDGETMSMTGHNSVASLVGYQRGAALDSVAANIFDLKRRRD